MKQSDLLSVTSVLSMLLLSLHISQEIVVGGVMAAGMLPLHMRNGLRPELLERSGALLFIWTLYVLGVTGAFTVILAVQALRGQQVAP